MGCQDLLEDVPGRPKKESDGSSSPMDLRFFKKGVTGRSSSKSYSVKEDVSDEIMAMLKLDNNTVAQTSWRPCSQQVVFLQIKIRPMLVINSFSFRPGIKGFP